MISEDRRIRNGLTLRWIEPLLLFAGYLLVSNVLFWPYRCHVLGADDLQWIRGVIVGGGPWRLVFHYLFHHICRPLFGFNPLGYHLLCFFIHAINAFLVYQFFILALPVREGSLQRSALHIGGVVAGFIFLLSDINSPSLPAALLFMLVVTFSLLALIFAVLFFRHGRALFWLPVVVFYGLSLLTLIYSMALPVLIGLLEIAWRRRSTLRFSLKGTAFRYLVPAGLLVLFLWRYWDTLVVAGVDGLKQETTPSLLLMFPWYLLMSVKGHWGYIKNAVFCRDYVMDFPFDAHIPGLPDELALVVLCALCVHGVKEIRRRDRAVGIAGSFLLFFIVWDGLPYFQHMASGNLTAYWHYYFNTVGFSMVVAYVIVRSTSMITDRVWQSSWPSFRSALVWAVILGLPLSLLFGNPNYRRRLLVEIHAGNLSCEQESLNP